MNPYKALFAVLIFILITATSNAQKHYNSWIKTTLSYGFTKKIKADVEFHYRSQSALENKNPFDKNLMNAIRTMVHYKYNGHLQFSISPFAYFSNGKIILTPSDATATPTNEYRFSAFVEMDEQIVSKIFLQNRTGVEYRIFPMSTTNSIRVRNGLALRYDANAKFSFMLGDELFVNVSGISTVNIFDQNRIIVNATFKPTKNIRLELGYIHNNRILKNSNDLIIEENFLLNIGFMIPRK